MINIRKAKKKDFSDIIRLIKHLATYERQPDAVILNAKELRKIYNEKNPQLFMYVADYDNKIVGMLIAYKRFSSWKGRTLHIEDFIVDETCRNKGIGKKLFDKAIQLSKKLKVNRLEWEVLEWNTPAIEFYKKYPVHFDPEWTLCKMYP